MFQTNNNFSAIANNVQRTCTQLIAALADFQEMQEWSAGVSIADLIAAGAPVDPDFGEPGDPGHVGTPQTSAEASAIKDCLADGAGLSVLFTTGTDPRNPPAGYVYGASIRNVAGTKTRQ